MRLCTHKETLFQLIYRFPPQKKKGKNRHTTRFSYNECAFLLFLRYGSYETCFDFYSI